MSSLRITVLNTDYYFIRSIGCILRAVSKMFGSALWMESSRKTAHMGIPVIQENLGQGCIRHMGVGTGSLVGL